MWHGSNYYSKILSQIVYNYGGQFQYFSGVDLKLNHWASLIAGLIKAPTRQVQIKLESQPGGSLVTDRDLTRLVVTDHDLT